MQENLSFGQAVEAMQNDGMLVNRVGWNGNLLLRKYAPSSRAPVVFEGLTYILLSDGKVAFCDEGDYEIAAQQELWSVSNGYPYYTDYSAGADKCKTVKLHQLLNPSWGQTDHANGNKLDNRRCNLRECTSQQNNANRQGKSGTSQYKGVSWDSSRDKWIASIQFNKKTNHLGRFEEEEEAARAYDNAAKAAHGRFARLNFPGTGMYLFAVKDNEWDLQLKEGHRALESGDLQHLVNQPFVVMRTAQGMLVPWLASQSDVLGNDWRAFETPEEA